MYVIAYDIGTTGVKTCLFEAGETLRLLEGEYEGYGLLSCPTAVPSRTPTNGGRR